MSRIDERFATLRRAGRKGLVTYVTAGDPDLARSAEIIMRLDRAGVAVSFEEELGPGTHLSNESRAIDRVADQVQAARDLVGEDEKDDRGDERDPGDDEDVLDDPLASRGCGHPGRAAGGRSVPARAHADGHE